MSVAPNCSLFSVTFGGLISRLSDVINGVTEAEQEIGQHVDDVGLEESAEHVAQHLEGEEGALAVVRVLLVRHGIRQLLHDVQLL